MENDKKMSLIGSELSKLHDNHMVPIAKETTWDCYLQQVADQLSAIPTFAILNFFKKLSLIKNFDFKIESFSKQANIFIESINPNGVVSNQSKCVLCSGHGLLVVVDINSKTTSSTGYVFYKQITASCSCSAGKQFSAITCFDLLIDSKRFFLSNDFDELKRKGFLSK